MKVPFSRVACDGNELAYVREVIAGGWLTTAKKCFEFEKQFCAQVRGAQAVAVNSATAALHLALEAIGVGRGDRVIVPAMTFTATAEVIRYLGADPVFVDVQRGSNLIQAEDIASTIAKDERVRAVIVVHFGGQPANMEAIMTACRPRGVKVIEDAAHAFPAAINGQPIGSIGDVTCFSFYANKTITTGEGGMLVTRDQAIAARARVMRLHGIDRDVWNRFTSEKPSWEYDVVAPGFKYNLTDLAAAIGLAQLEKAYVYRERRQEIAEMYMARWRGLRGVELPRILVPHADHAWHLFWIVLTPAAKLARGAFVDELTRRGIGFSVHYKPLYRMTYYRDLYKLASTSFPNSEWHWSGCVSLPIFPTMTADEVEYVSESVAQILE